MVSNTNLGGENLRQALQQVENLGLSQLVFPFLLIFILTYAILQKIELFGKKGINGALSFIIALLVTIPHVLGMYPPGKDPIVLMYIFLPNTAIVLGAIFVMILLLGGAGVPLPSLLMSTIAIIAAGILVFTFAVNMFPFVFPETLGFLRDPTTQAILFIALIIGLVGYFVFREKQDDEMTWSQRVEALTAERPRNRGGQGGS